MLLFLCVVCLFVFALDHSTMYHPVLQQESDLQDNIKYKYLRYNMIIGLFHCYYVCYDIVLTGNYHMSIQTFRREKNI